MKLSLQQLSEQTGVTERSIRFYIQKGLLPRPLGGTRAAHYTEAHLADLLRIREWQAAGLSLEAIGDLLAARDDAPIAPLRRGAIEVRSHLVIDEGIELAVAPDRAGLTQAQIRQLFQAIKQTVADIRGDSNDEDSA